MNFALQFRPFARFLRRLLLQAIPVFHCPAAYMAPHCLTSYFSVCLWRNEKIWRIYLQVVKWKWWNEKITDNQKSDSESFYKLCIFLAFVRIFLSGVSLKDTPINYFAWPNIDERSTEHAESRRLGCKAQNLGSFENGLFNLRFLKMFWSHCQQSFTQNL